MYQIISDIRSNKLDIDAVREILGVTKMPGRLVGNAKKGGIDPQEYAEVYGYSSAEQMLREVIEVDSLNKAAEDAAQAVMLDRHGDILNDGRIEQMAQEALHNSARAEVLLDELKALNKGAPAIDREYLKAQAKTLIGKMTFKQIQPNKFLRAEIRAAEMAATAENAADRLEAKIQQLANHYLYKEALDQKDRMTRNRRYIRKAQSRQYDTKQVDPGYVANIKSIANMYDLRDKKARERAALDLLNWYQAQLDNPDQLIKPELFDPHLVEALVQRDAGGPPYTPPYES